MNKKFIWIAMLIGCINAQSSVGQYQNALENELRNNLKSLCCSPEIHRYYVDPHVPVQHSLKINVFPFHQRFADVPRQHMYTYEKCEYCNKFCSNPHITVQCDEIEGKKTYRVNISGDSKPCISPIERHNAYARRHGHPYEPHPFDTLAQACSDNRGSWEELLHSLWATAREKDRVESGKTWNSNNNKLEIIRESSWCTIQ